ncbi:hypothetical protein [Marinobacterium litorale]|uniref:hypothetical protein n=1 Tax=Marinobacterium litorale TaxID=404770 RepID=UPI00042A81AA|nr:hypothetical protein [Marinobacterium litorale]
MIARLIAVASLALMLGSAAGYWKGHADGSLQAQAATDEQAVTDLNALIEQHRTLVTESNKASQRVKGLLADRQSQDRKTTKTLKELLDETAAMRSECRFDDRVMRELDAARERAARAVTGGLDGAVPGAGEPGG